MLLDLILENGNPFMVLYILFQIHLWFGLVWFLQYSAFSELEL